MLGSAKISFKLFARVAALVAALLCLLPSAASAATPAAVYRRSRLDLSLADV